ncbi:MAG: hypothetical protein WCW36_01070 [Candidatus Paceibacterota bacterium]
MAKTIFFSWQMDTPQDVGRRFLREALEEACKAITGETTVSEAQRDESAELVVESDTEGVAGQPPVVETILKKIDEAAIVIADITFTGTRMDARLTPNANVLIEYGWALKSLGHARALTVMNEAYGKATRDSLPFDLSHLRFPIRYTLTPDASTEQRKEEKAKLVGNLKVAIRSSLTTLPTPTPEPIPEFPRATAKDGPARFRSPKEELGIYENFRGLPALPVFLNKTNSAIWLRLMPSKALDKEWTPRELKETAQRNGGISLIPLTHGSGLDWLRAEDGWGVYTPAGETKEGATERWAHSTAFVFQTGEIWSVDTAWLEYMDNYLPFIEAEFTRKFEEYVSFLRLLDIQSPYHWEAGITGVKGRECHVPIAPGKARLQSWHGPVCLSDTIRVEGTYQEGQTATQALLPFYEEIFERCGVKRPDHLPKK